MRSRGFASSAGCRLSAPGSDGRFGVGGESWEKNKDGKNIMTERKTVRRWWSSVTINRTEFWLTEMAEQGWALEDIQDNRFVFQKTEPQYREYFLPCLGWLYRGKVAERLSQIDILCNTRYGTDLRMRRIFVEIDVSKVNQNIAPLYQKRYRICRNEHLGFYAWKRAHWHCTSLLLGPTAGSIHQISYCCSLPFIWPCEMGFECFYFGGICGSAEIGWRHGALKK